MCIEPIYGSDIDILTWDFGMCDTLEYERLLHYGYRSMLSPGRPAIIGLHYLGDYGDNERSIQFGELEKRGSSVLIASQETRQKMSQAVPDTEGMTEEQIRAMPEYVRNFKCAGQIEMGDPYCSLERYNEYVCPERKGRANWHPGL